MSNLQQQILDLVKANGEVSYSDLKQAFSQIHESTLTRNLKQLIEQGELKKKREGRHTFYFVKSKLEEFFDQPVWQRPKVTYNPDFVRSYQPGKTFFLSKQNLQKLEKSVRYLPLNTDFYKTNKRFLERQLIDLSFASSYLEGNTYSYLDTEVLLKYSEINKQKSREETQMILNHKKAIEHLIFYKSDLDFSQKTFFEVHQLLGEGLLPSHQLGILRKGPVQIGGSTYQPPQTQAQLQQEFEIFLQKLNQIKNPFEQSFFIMVFLPYFQLFHDVNKRLSRIIGNFPLIKHNLPVLSLLKVPKKQYILAILAIYELNDVKPLEQIWTQNYLSNLENYKLLLEG